MTLPKCLTCRFYVRHFPDHPEALGPGDCHRFPPNARGFAPVSHGDWCGEHQELTRTVDQTIEVMRQRGLL